MASRKTRSRKTSRRTAIAPGARPSSIATTPKRGDFRKTKYARAKRDWYCEPAWVVHALIDRCHALIRHAGGLVYDPCCGVGNIVRAARARGFQAFGTDIEDRGGGGLADFMELALPAGSVPTIIFNPPYRGARAFVERARQVASHLVCAFLPIAWLASERRFDFFDAGGLYQVIVMSSRPSLPPGHLLMNDLIKAEGGRTDFAWFIWLKGYVGPPTITWARSDPLIDAAHR